MLFIHSGTIGRPPNGKIVRLVTIQTERGKELKIQTDQVKKMERQMEQLIRIVASLNERVIALEMERQADRLEKEARMIQFTLNR